MTIYKRKNKYYCRFQIDGERHHYLCNGATTEKEAKKIEDGFRYKLQQQQNGVMPQNTKDIKLKVLLKLYDDYSRINKKSYGNDAFKKYIGEYFGSETLVKNIKVDKIDMFKSWLIKERKSSHSTINKYLAALSKMFNLGIENKLIFENPVKYIKKYREDNHKVRYLTMDEEQRLFKSIDKRTPYINPLVICALQTGMRRGEIFNLKWSNIDFNYKFIELLETKSGKSRKIPISNKLMELFNNLFAKAESEYVFINSATGKPYKDIKKSFSSVLKDANIKNFRFHDLRHTVGTRLAEKGIPLGVIQEILGHAKISTTMRYAHVIPQQKVQAISVLNSYS